VLLACTADGPPRPSEPARRQDIYQPPRFDGLRLPAIPVDPPACFSFFAARFSFSDIPGFLALGLLGDLSAI
jgi:hypothetical protein